MTKNFVLPEFDTLDDLLYSSYDYINKNGQDITSKRGSIKEVLNFAVTLLNPRARVSKSLDRRLVRSKFAEFAWYLSRDSDKSYIKPYIKAYNNEDEENNKILGGYGPKIFSSENDQLSQFDRICKQITYRNETKQAFLVLSNDSDYKVRLNKYSSPPCTIGLHFIVRQQKLNLTTYMRSNDAYYGLPHDLFCFTMLQELISCRVGIPLGKYTHISTSMHIYDNHLSKINNYLNEGFHESISMPKMQSCEDKSISIIINAFDETVDKCDLKVLDSYWHDYALFSNRFSKKYEKDKWLDKFSNNNMKSIAECSISI